MARIWGAVMRIVDHERQSRVAVTNNGLEIFTRVRRVD